MQLCSLSTVAHCFVFFRFQVANKYFCDNGKDTRKTLIKEFLIKSYITSLEVPGKTLKQLLRTLKTYTCGGTSKKYFFRYD